MPACARAGQFLLTATARPPTGSGTLSHRTACCERDSMEMLRRSSEGVPKVFRRTSEGLQGFPPLFLPSDPILLARPPVLFSCMKRVKPMAYLAASAALAAVVLTGCARVQSQSSVTNPTVVSPPFTNAAMDKYQKAAAAELKQKLTPMQFAVTQHAATEPPFRNE